ncbi:uncharacterized protein LOC131678857 [Topomyia yanbarensis]|uniref:uncharacterized protein LOC131678857 n=1 Tax=Topomyia yanbarensis TaxID=2498891 RepID=UPI00273C103A|nr:uncharacterized protein LOC131678857 [Topomyia yanbarensis]
METPLFQFNPADRDLVYEPAEDTFLLLDALEDELAAMKRLRPLVSLEIGCGSGVVISALAKALGNASGCFLGVDINPHACRMTRKTAEVNHCDLNVINMDLLNGFRPGLIDLLVFNPPYVPTCGEPGERLEEQIEQFGAEGYDLVKSWAGGLDGMVVTNKILNELDRLLSPVGVFYLLLLRENKPTEIIRRLESEHFKVNIVKERKIRGEHLFVLKVARNES